MWDYGKYFAKYCIYTCKRRTILLYSLRMDRRIRTLEFEQVLHSNIEHIIVEKDKLLSEMTTFHTGGKAAYTVYVDTAAQAAAVFSLAA